MITSELNYRAEYEIRYELIILVIHSNRCSLINQRIFLTNQPISLNKLTDYFHSHKKIDIINANNGNV